MANGKAPGPSGATSDALRSMTWTEQDPKKEVINDDAKFLVSIIHAMLVDFWEDSHDFESWTSGTLSPVLKKGDLSDLNKWRPVCLLKITYIGLASTLAYRINPIIRDNGLEAQCSSHNSKDLVKAFDSVNHKFLWLVLCKYGIPDITINIIKKMHHSFALKFTVGAATKAI
eukprot:1958123-Ditylum_brightwellii.AAC.1